MSTFLDDAELVKYTGRAQKKKQIEHLRQMGVAFTVNAVGRAVVARAVVEGRQSQAPAPKAPWVPPGLRVVR